MKSFECTSPSELDRKFFGEESLVSALSLEQLSTSRVLNDTAANGSDPRVSILASLCLASDISPCPGSRETDNCHLAVPLQGRSSTPLVLLQKPKMAACFDKSYSDGASQIVWDLSLIKMESSSPRVNMESSTLEHTWSPKPHQQSLAGVSPRWTWTGSMKFASAPAMHQQQT